jgi:hypothetical protein
MKAFLVPATLLAAASLTYGQSDTNRRWYATLGLYVPSTSTGLSTSTGAYSSIGYQLTRSERSGLNIESGGGTFTLRDGFGGQGTGMAGGLSLVSVNYGKDQKSYFGVGLGISSGSIRSGGVTVSDDTRLLYSLEYGSDLSRTTFARLKYQFAPGSTTRFYNGLALEFGYRF